MIVFAFLLIATTLAMAIPFFNPGVISGHDISAHSYMVQLFFKAFSSGQFPVRFIEGVTAGMDQPHFLFYPPLFYYLTSLPQLLHLPYVTATYITLGFVTALGFVGIFLFVRVYYGHLAALISATAFTLAPYRILQLYVRASFPEYLALSLLGFVFWGVALIFQDKKIGILITAFSLAALVLAHQPTLLMILPLLVGFVLVSWVKSQNNWQLFWSVKAAIFGAGLSGFFTLPAIFERQYVNLGSLTSGYYDFRTHFADISQIIYSKWGWGVSQIGIADGMSFALGIIGWLTVIGAIILFFSKTSPLNKFWTGFFTTGVVFAVFMAIATSQPIWEAINIFSFVQYPWRFISIATFCYSLLLAPLTKYIFSFQKVTNLILLFFAAAAIISLSLPILKPAVYLPRDKFDLDKAVFDETTQDPTLGLETGYLPIWAKRLDTTNPPEKVRIIAGQAEVKLIKDSPTQKVIEVNSLTAAMVRVTSHYFPGAKATINPKPFTQNLEITHDNPEGYIDILVPKGKGKVMLLITNTPIRTMGEVTTLVTLAFLILDQILSSNLNWKVRLRPGKPARP